MLVIGFIGSGKIIIFYVVLVWFDVSISNIFIVEDLVEYDLLGIS